MPLLSAKFDLKPKSTCILSLPEDIKTPSFSLTIDNFNIDIEMFHQKFMKRRNEPNWMSFLGLVILKVSREELEGPPEVIISTEGYRDYTTQNQYLLTKLPQFKEAAFSAINRVLNFFRYQLMTPSIQEFPLWDEKLSNPSWSFDGRELRGAVISMSVTIPNLPGKLGCQALTYDKFTEFASFIQNPTEPTLPNSLLSDAQTAWVEKHLRRSVLELAICAEVLVKRKYFEKDSPAGDAFDFLEDKSRVTVKVLDLIDAIAIEAFSKSYKIDHPDHYENIDYLFRCRNKIAHRGELLYRNKHGVETPVNAGEVESWWNSVFHLKGWLKDLT